MAWQNYSILGGDITKDIQYEIYKMVGGQAFAASVANSTTCTFNNPLQETFVSKLHDIYAMCKSNNRIEETWNMQVLALFVLENELWTAPCLRTNSARVLWNHISYEMTNLSNFGWDQSAQPHRLAALRTLYDNFGRINFRGSREPFGLSFGLSFDAPPVLPASVTPAPVLPTPVAPAPVVSPTCAPACETVIIPRGILPGLHTVGSVITPWSKYIYAEKQWSYRLLHTDRGVVVQTRWGKRMRSTSALRVNSKAFHSRTIAIRYINTVINTKLNSGYRSAALA